VFLIVQLVCGAGSKQWIARSNFLSYSLSDSLAIAKTLFLRNA